MCEQSEMGRVGHLTLARPEAINALTPGMVRTLVTTLVAWRDDPSVEVVVLDGEGGRGFCAGGDIKFVHTYATRAPERVRAFWREEYQLDALIASSRSLSSPWRTGSRWAVALAWPVMQHTAS